MKFRDIRKTEGITQTALAERLGVRQSTVAMWKTGRSTPKTADLPKIAKALNVSVEQVIACFTADAEETA